MFIYDIETASTTEKSILLSMAILWFDENKKYTLSELFNNSCYVKFDIKEQKEKYGRIADKKTVEWWKKQCDIVKKASLLPSEKDVALADGIEIVKNYINKYKKGDDIVWTRGSMDQFILDNVCTESLKIPELFGYGNYMDVRTAINLLKDTAKRGYCDIELEGYDSNVIIKHHPTHDVIFDTLMLLYGK